MFSAALFTQKWSTQKARLIRERFLSANPTEDDEDESTALQDGVEEKKTLHITLQINETKEGKEEVDNGTVMFNQDEDRFTQESTLNLKTFCHYTITVELHHHQKLEYVSLGRKTYFNIIKDQPEKEFFYITENSCGTRSYSFVYSTDKVRATDRHHRTVLPCKLKLLGYGELKFKLLVNFCYSNKMDHMVGVPLSSIGIEATFGAETTLDAMSFERQKSLVLA